MTDDMTDRESTLPALSDARIDEIENALFARIRQEQDSAGSTLERTRRRRRGRVWLTAGAAAAVVVVAAAIAPALSGVLGGASSGSDAAPAITGADEQNVEGSDGGVDLDGPVTVRGDAAEASAQAREIVATASATVRVADPEDAAERIAAAAEDLGGYVEALSIGGGAPVPIDSGMQPMSGSMEPGSPESALGVSPDSAWMTIRVPASRLDEATAELRQVGEVLTSQIDRRDVTGEAVDLRARIDALRASVDRLTALLAEAETTSDLIAAEEALATRQSELESYEQQLKMLDELVGMSTLTVSLVTPEDVVTADPAGFGDGVAAGWNGLVATLNGIVIALGFLLPWLAVAGIAVLVVWVVRRARRRSRARTAEETETWDD